MSYYVTEKNDIFFFFQGNTFVYRRRLVSVERRAVAPRVVHSVWGLEICFRMDSIYPQVTLPKKILSVWERNQIETTTIFTTSYIRHLANLHGRMLANLLISRYQESSIRLV